MILKLQDLLWRHQKAMKSGCWISGGRLGEMQHFRKTDLGEVQRAIGRKERQFPSEEKAASDMLHCRDTALGRDPRDKQVSTQSLAGSGRQLTLTCNLHSYSFFLKQLRSVHVATHSSWLYIHQCSLCVWG